MNRRFKKTILSAVFFLALFYFSGPALALEQQYPTIFGLTLNDTSKLSDFACYLFGLLINLAIAVAVLSTIFGGVLYIISLVKGQYKSDAKEWIKSGILGLIIVVAASLISYTINPDLRKCSFTPLLPINIIPPNPDQPPPKNLQIRTFNEIPIGVLTENLLTRTINCYDFDQNGDPVEGNIIGTSGYSGPTYINHDRADCLLKLMDGAQKKAQVAAELSSELISLMNTCACDGKCPGCTDPEGCLLTTNGKPTGIGGACQGSAYYSMTDEQKNALSYGSCKDVPCTTSPSPTDCCPTGVKNKIEHGPISLSINIDSSQTGCQSSPINYRGLDEFRCNGANCSGSNVKNFTERTIPGTDVIIIDTEKWRSLSMLQQLMYFQEKITEVNQQIDKDKQQLEAAEALLASNDCYLPASNADLLHLYETTNQIHALVLTSKIFNEPPESNNKIDTSEYCSGYNYENSSCFKKCNDICPDYGSDVRGAYANCPSSDQEDCIKKAFFERPCAPGTYQNFESCVSDCQQECTLNCEKIDSQKCSNEYNLCRSQCSNNSTCILENAETCLFNESTYLNLQNCSSSYTDQGNFSYCVDRAYACKNGSDQYAGYPDCAEPSSLSCPNYTTKEACENDNKCLWSGDACYNNYSASFFFTNQNKEKCFVTSEGWSNPYKRADAGTACYSSDPKRDQCRYTCTEVEKCPSTSQCPRCPCDTLSDASNPGEPLILNFSKPSKTAEIKAGQPKYVNETFLVQAYQMVGAQCNNSSYNGDPLVFYCEQNWKQTSGAEKLQQEKPQGAKLQCTKNNEVPVGRVIDDAEKWSENLIANAERIDPNSGQTFLQIIVDRIKKAGEAINSPVIRDYCKCSAKFEDSSPVCISKCEYYQSEIPFLQCGSRIIACHGNSCQQVVDYLSEIWDAFREFKIDFIKSYTYMIAEPRSDILKELIYSRETVNKCGVTEKTSDSKYQLLNCERIKKEIISPVNKGEVIYEGIEKDVGCYGMALGKLVDEQLADNWFCCNEVPNSAQIK